MKSYVILGDTGFIGSAFIRHLTSKNKKIIGINRSRVRLIENTNVDEYSRRSKNLFQEMEPYLSEDSAVINATWGKNERHNRQSQIHRECAVQEESLIQYLLPSKIRYLSFGSIAEIDDEQISPSWGTQYAKSKKQICEYLSSTSLQSIWLRIASCYGPEDKRDWLLTQLAKSWKHGNELVLENPNQLLNLCHIDSLVIVALELLESNRTGIFNVVTNQWLTVHEIKNCFDSLVEPVYLNRTSGAFSSNDSESIVISAPLISKYFESLKGDYKS